MINFSLYSVEAKGTQWWKLKPCRHQNNRIRELIYEASKLKIAHPCVVQGAEGAAVLYLHTSLLVIVRLQCPKRTSLFVFWAWLPFCSLSLSAHTIFHTCALCWLLLLPPYCKFTPSCSYWILHSKTHFFSWLFNMQNLNLVQCTGERIIWVYRQGLLLYSCAPTRVLWIHNGGWEDGVL